MVTRVAIGLYRRRSSFAASRAARTAATPEAIVGERSAFNSVRERHLTSCRTLRDFRAEATGALGERDRSCMSAPPWPMRFICAPRSRDKCPAARPKAVARLRRAQRNTDLSFEHSRVETVRPLRSLEA